MTSRKEVWQQPFHLRVVLKIPFRMSRRRWGYWEEEIALTLAVIMASSGTPDCIVTVTIHSISPSTNTISLATTIHDVQRTTYLPCAICHVPHTSCNQLTVTTATVITNNLMNIVLFS